MPVPCLPLVNPFLRSFERHKQQFSFLARSTHSRFAAFKSERNQTFLNMSQAQDFLLLHAWGARKFYAVPEIIDMIIPIRTTLPSREVWHTPSWESDPLVGKAKRGLPTPSWPRVLVRRSKPPRYFLFEDEGCAWHPRPSGTKG